MCWVPNGQGFGFALERRGKVSSQNGEGNQTTYLASEVAFEAINEWESMSVRNCVSEP